MNRCLNRIKWHGVFACLALLCGVLMAGGCGREEQAKAPGPASAKVSKKVAGPPTRALLGLMPDEAAAALAVPNFSDPYLTVLGLWEHAQTDAAAFHETVRASAREWAAAWDIEADTENHLDVLRAVGIDVDAPAALFIDAESFGARVESAKHQESGLDAPDVAGEKRPPRVDAGEMPLGAAIIHCTDVKRVEEALPGLVSRAFGRPVNGESVEIDGLPMQRLSPVPFWYLFDGKRLIFGTRPTFAAAVMRKQDAPASVRYGTAECPAESDREIVALARLAQIHELEHAAHGGNRGTGSVVGLLSQLLPGDAKESGPISDDPLVATLTLEENRVALRARLDVKEHPALLELWGTPPRIDYLGMMPETTKGVLSLGLTPEWKALVIEGIQENSPDNSTASALAETLLNAMGDEITLAVTGTRDDLPVFVLLAEITQPDLFKGVVQLSGGKLVAVDEGAGDGIMRLDIPMDLPTPVFATIGQDHLFVANDLELLREIDATQKSGAPSRFLGTFAPPVDPEAERYSLFLLSESGIAEVLSPLLLDPSVREQYGPALTMLRELRASQELDGSWQTTSVDLFLN